MVLNIKGIQKITLLDYPDKLACTLFFAGCNFKCPSCHNPGLVFDEGEILNEEEVLEILEKRRNFIEGVCLTGGEPLVSDLKELEEFIKKIKQKDLYVKIDTNGGFSEKLRELIEKKLIDYVALDVKAPQNLYSKVAGVEVDIKKIEESMRLISNSEIDYEFRTTICPIIVMNEIRWMTAKEIEELAKWIVKTTGTNKHKYCLQRFVPRKKGLVDLRLENFPKTSENLMDKMYNVAKDILINSEVRGMNE